MLNFLKNIDRKDYKAGFGGLEILKYIGPGLLVTVGFIDPGNWASNLAAGADFGYALLWVVGLSTLMLILLQHNAAHLGIATGLCLSEAASIHLKPRYSRIILSSAMLASIATSLAEILGGAIALNMLFNVPLKIAAILVSVFVSILLFTSTYKVVEKWIIAFVSVIGLAFLYEMTLIDVHWSAAVKGWITPDLPRGSILIVMSVLGAVVMPHNLFLHSEIIQSRQWNLKEESVIKKQLRYEFFDTLLSMIVGFAINSAIIILAASVFHETKTPVSQLEQAGNLLTPLLGKHAFFVFAVALLFSGVSALVTSGMSAGSIFAGMYGEPYDVKDNHSKLGIAISIFVALILVLFISDPFKALIISQMCLSIQLPMTIFLQVYLTSSQKIMGKHKNTTLSKIILYAIGFLVSGLNIFLFISLINNS